MLVSAMGEDGELGEAVDGPIFLAPGESGAVILRPNPAGFGPWSKIYKVLSNDPDLESSRISLSMEIEPRFRVDLRTLDLGEVSADLDTVIRVSIVAASGEDFRVLGTERAEGDPRSRGKRALLEGAPLRAETGAGHWFLDLRFRPGPAAGPLLEKIQLLTSDSLVPRIELAVQATVSPDIIYPKQFEMTGFRGVFQIRRRGGPPLGIGDIRLNHPHLRAELEVVEIGEAYRLRIERLPSSPRDLFLPWLLIETDHPDHPLLRIKVRSRAPKSP